MFKHTLWPKAWIISYYSCSIQDCADARPALHIYNSLLLIRYLWEDESFMKFPATCLLNPMPNGGLGLLATCCNVNQHYPPVELVWHTLKVIRTKHNHEGKLSKTRVSGSWYQTVEYQIVSSFPVLPYFLCVNLTPHMVYFSLYLYKLGIAPQIQDLLGKVAFTGNISSSWNQTMAQKHKRYINICVHAPL